METAKERFNTIVAETNHYCKKNNIDVDTCKNLTLDNVLREWQKDIDKIAELEIEYKSKIKIVLQCLVFDGDDHFCCNSEGNPIFEEGFIDEIMLKFEKEITKV